MASQFIVAIFARVIHAAAFHLDGNNIFRLVIMGAARLGVRIDSFNGRARHRHNYPNRSHCIVSRLVAYARCGADHPVATFMARCVSAHKYSSRRLALTITTEIAGTAYYVTFSLAKGLP